MLQDGFFPDNELGKSNLEMVSKDVNEDQVLNANAEQCQFKSCSDVKKLKEKFV